MTTGTYEKVMKQVAKKKNKLIRFKQFNIPKHRKTGIGSRRCSRCGRYGAHISKYNLNVCRQCFREIAFELGFRKYGHEV